MKPTLLMHVFLLVFTIFALSCGGSGGGGGKATEATFKTGDYTAATLSASTVGASGGTISITDAASPLNGLSIVVPPGATNETITFIVQYADISDASGLPKGTGAASKMIQIQTTGSDDWNAYRMFDQPLKVTLPYTAPTDGEETVRFYFVNADKTLEPMGLEGRSTTNKTITFYTRTFGSSSEAAKVKRLGLRKVFNLIDVSASIDTFATYVAVGLGTLHTGWFTNGKTIDTGFRPSKNGWYIPNYGSYYKKSRGGNCFGMVGLAKWYYKKDFGPTLYKNYHDAKDTKTWLDDSTAIEFASRVHNGMSQIWEDFISGEVNVQDPSSRDVALSWLGALYVTGNPALAYIQQAVNLADGTKKYSGAHAVSVYKAAIGAHGDVEFFIYDPNKPKDDDGPRLTYVDGTGLGVYHSGTTAADSKFTYNFFKHVGFHVGLSDAVLEAMKASADKNFTDDTVFPKITITSITGATNSETVFDGTSSSADHEGTTSEGEHKYITTDTAVRIQGTILGGLAQDACCVVNNARVFVSNQVWSVGVNNAEGSGNGVFDITVPVAQGENDLVIIGAKQKSLANWAAFYRNVIESTASPAALTVTMSWDQASSDVDLYVKEPDQASPAKIGDTVYWQHRKGTSTANPYLDFDNTSGYGPEHYFAKPGMKTLFTDASESSGMYGDYSVKVHYYADHDSDTTADQPISWHATWRYLAYCPGTCASPEDDGFWVEGGESGALTAASSGNCCNITKTGVDWSSAFTISYPAPNPDDWTIPDPPKVMLP